MSDVYNAATGDYRRSVSAPHFIADNPGYVVVEDAAAARLVNPVYLTDDGTGQPRPMTTAEVDAKNTTLAEEQKARQDAAIKADKAEYFKRKYIRKVTLTALKAATTDTEKLNILLDVVLGKDWQTRNGYEGV